MLFGKLPDEIFRPLSGVNRNIFEKVLKRLHALFFDDDNPESDSPRRELILHEIFQVLAQEEFLALRAEDEDDVTVVYDNIPAASDYIYRRLLRTGWLEVEEDGYHINIVPNPNARLLLDALIDIERREKKSYGLVVVSILSHIESAITSPKDRGIVFTDAVAQTREFSNHLRGIFYSLKEVQELLARQKDPRQVLASFFEEFVENILIADYKTLNAADNPFRFRFRIQQLLQEAELIDSIFNPLAESYQIHYSIPPEEAKLRLKRDIDYIARVFKSVDRRLAKIDSFRFRLENRVSETVRLIDRTMPGISNRLADLLQNLSEHFSEDCSTELIPGPEVLSQTRQLSPFSIYSPHGKKIRPAPQMLRAKVVNPEIKKRKELIRAFMKKRAFEPYRVVDYLEKQMGNRTVMSAGEFDVESVEELISFLLIRHLPRMRGRGQIRARSFAVNRGKDMIETPWITCRTFIVERR